MKFELFPKKDVKERFNILVDEIKRAGFEYFQTDYGIFVNADNRDVIKVLPKHHKKALFFKGEMNCGKIILP